MGPRFQTEVSQELSEKPGSQEAGLQAFYLVPAKSVLLSPILSAVLCEISFERGVLLIFKTNTTG